MGKSPKSPSKTKAAASRKPSLRGKATTNKSGKRTPVEAREACVVFGTVTYADTAPAAGLTVIAYDKDESREDRLGQATTDASGAYRISYRASTFRRSPKERGGADVIVRVYNDTNEVLFAGKKKNSAPAEYRLNIQLPAQHYVVRGSVIDANGKPLSNMIVRALDRDLRFPQLLGTDETGANGDYRIDYSPEDFRLGDLPSRRFPWLIVEVRQTAEGEALARQEVPKADRDQIVSFMLSNAGGISEWQRISEAVAPLLKGQGALRLETGSHGTRTDLAPEDVTANDLDFIVIETGLDRTAVEAWAVSSRMVRDAVLRLTDEHAAQQDILREHGWSFFYGLVRQGGASDLDAVLRSATSDWQKAWEAARAVNQVSALDEQQVERLMAVLSLLRRVQQLDAVRADNGEFARVLAHAPLPLPVTVALDALAVVQERGLDDTDALLKLAERYPEAEAPIKTFVRSVRVHRLAGGHGEFTRVLNARLEGVSDSIAPLAGVQATEWIGMAEAAGVSPGLALQTQAQVEQLHPLTALESKIRAGLFDVPGRPGSDVAALIKKQPEMVEKLLLGKAPVQDEEAATHTILRNTGRFLRTGVSMELAAGLMKGGIGSPGAALRYGREHLRKQYRDRLPEAAVTEVLDGFLHYADGLVEGGKGATIEIDINRRGPSYYRQKDLEEYTVPLPEAVRENAPTLAALFGDPDECLCRPCESMLGQPAYLVDLLNLLAKSTGANGSALDELRSRRPDIFNLKLSCANAEQTIQHIDIVLEILEKAAAPEAPQQATAEAIRQLVYPKLRQAIYPWHLPFDHGYAGVRAYLAKLGVSRETLLKLRRSTTPEHLAAEALHAPMDQAGDPNADSEWELLTQPRQGARLWAAYGFAIDNDIAIVDPASREQLTNQTVQAILERASFLIDRTGLSLEELEQALKTEFVSGFQGGLTLTHRDQCKTSNMRLVIASEEGQLSPLEGCLDRLHRFTRLLRKFPGWSIPQLGNAIKACDGIEPTDSDAFDRAAVLVRLATVKRLHHEYGMPLEFLHDRPISEGSFRKMLGLSSLQLALLKKLTAIDPTAAASQPFNWAKVEEFCKAVLRIRESGLTVEQVAEALLTCDQLRNLFGELPSTIKSDEQIKNLLKAVQQRLRSVVAVRPDVSLEVQVVGALGDIYDRSTTDKLIQAIQDAGTADVAKRKEHLEALPILHGDSASRDARKLGEWLPLLSEPEAKDIIQIASNLSIASRLEKLLKGIVARRRERELIAEISGQCGLAESETRSLLGSRLLLAPSALDTQAAKTFLDMQFWADIPPPIGSDPATPPTVPGVMRTDVPRLYEWMDRLYRLISLRAALAIDDALMQLAERVMVGSNAGINWRDVLATLPATDSAWANPHWQALLDLVWLQKPEHLSRQALTETVRRLAELAHNGVQTVTEDAIRPIATRLELAWKQILLLAELAITTNTNSLRDPMQLRRAFELLLRARDFGADSAQMARLLNLADNEDAANAAKSLLEAKLAGDALKVSQKTISDGLRRQRREALVAYHTAQIVGRNNSDTWSDAKALYEHFLIDHQMEPCFETTRILEAVTAVQLFAQRILFGVEPEITAEPELKQRWTWMRNYRVWEANRKVFLFPENWLFPELRDDKSSSFKQLESALGQGELTQDLANQAFGQFLDDVATVGQTQVLGMFEDFIRASSWPHNQIRRDLYVVGRSANPPYLYYWRKCFDFGGVNMEWSPWQRVELDVQGDHVLPYVHNSTFHIAWPVLTRETQTESWTLNFYWSRFNGKGWHRAEKSTTPRTLPSLAFQTLETSFTFRCLPERDAVQLMCFGMQPSSLSSGVAAPAQEARSLPQRILTMDARNEFNQKCQSLKFQYFGQIYVPSDSGASVILVQEPQRSDVIGGIHIITWEVWVKAKANNGDLGFVKVETDPTGVANPSFTLHGDINGVPISGRSLGWPLGLWIADHQNVTTIPRVRFTASYSRGPKYWSSSSVDVDQVSAGNYGQTHLTMVIVPPSGDEPTLGELGIQDIGGLMPIAQLSVGVAGQSMWRDMQGVGLPIIAPGNSIFMNGTLGGGARSWPMQLPLAGDYAMVQPFGSSSMGMGGSNYWVLAPSDMISASTGSNSWFYREGDRSCFLEFRSTPPPIQTVSYGASFPEAGVIPGQWRNAGELASIQNGPISFGADALPAPLGSSQSVFWQDQVAGRRGFDLALPYAPYTWEIFFHAPLMIADQLSKQHKFEDAERWLRYVFDPTSGETGTDAKRFLKFRVFKDLNLNQQVIDDLTALAQAAGGFATGADIAAVNKLIDHWRDMPFRPFAIARRRHIAFLWRTLFAYLDNLIAWADSLYRRDTRESINEATMLYVLAERILGRRPQLHQGNANRPAYTYDEKISSWDAFANFWIDVGAQGHSNLKTAWRVKDTINQPNPEGMLYFCMPFNDKIVSYWNTVDARLSNIRNCRSIEGIQRSLPLMDAPIDPELLIRATAAGLDLGDVIAGLYAPPPHYRYSILSSRAAELANECKSLGAAMLSAIEKRDAEHLAQLRSSNEISLLKLVRDVRTLQIDEAEGNIGALRASRRFISARYAQYQRLLGKTVANALEEGKTAGEESILGRADGSISRTSNLGLITEENSQILSMGVARNWSDASSVSRVVASALHLTASGIFALPGSALLKVGEAADSLAKVSSTLGEAFGAISQIHQNESSHHSLMAGHIRRRDEWAFQSNQTLKELQQIDKQILANQIRIDITKKELDNHVEQIAQAKAIDEVMRSKFSNVQLYEWIKTELSKLHFNAYRMAMDMARRAERAASRELGVKQLNVVRNDHWNSLRDGLLAGERLHQDLKRLEITYLDQNRREYEVTKHVSLRRLNPLALTNLRMNDSNGQCSCEFDVPEWLFDLDTPGHYLRRIKSVSVSIPSVTGPYTSVSCKLTLLQSAVRHERTAANYPRAQGDDPRFTDYFGASEAIVTSSGNGDSGLFEAQLRDERFLPFEGSGVISTWRLELPGKYPQFDYATITDVVLSIRYTARDGGEDLRNAATAAIDAQLSPSSPSPASPLRFPVVLSGRADFPTEWARAGTTSDLKVSLSRSLLPYWMDAAGLVVREVRVADLPKAAQSPLDFKPVWPPPTGVTDPAPWPADALNGDGVGEGNFGRVMGVIDKLILLNVGVRGNSSPTPT